MATNNAVNEPTAASGTVLQGQGVGTTSAFSTATYPATTTANDILYSSATNVVGQITTAASGVLITSSGSVPSISSTLPAAVQGNITTVGNLGNTLNTTRTLVLAYVNANVSNISGDSTNYVIIFNSTIFDQASNFNTTTGTFTAPVTGKYNISSNILLSGLLITHTGCQFQIVATARTIPGSISNVGANKDVNNDLSCSFSNFVDMTAGDTLTMHIQISGGTKTVGIFGGSNPLYSSLSIQLL